MAEASNPNAANPSDEPLSQPNLTAGYVSSHSDRLGHEPGDLIGGKYKLLELLGEGGMGSVWSAQQTESVKRLVAVKLIKPGMDSRAVLTRFDGERQALALMDHPNIARVFDAGATSDGRPYFVMELVKGIPITRFCDAQKLTPSERLALFVPVCQAIQHAHQKGIIHRDIKPGNVLVARYDDRPVPKVIDFGVAKATGANLTEHSLITGIGTIVGTAEYMSPEQATLDNLDIDTRSDVYSLGVLLYELLAGSPPFSRRELKQAGLMEVLRMVREEEPPRPSTKLSTADGLPSLAAKRGTEPRKLTGMLRNELDWIVMRALEKDRSRRYETANGFAADIQRFLAGEPVQAVPPSVAYRLQKFLRRNRGPVIAAGIVFLVLIGGIVGTTSGLLWADQQRRLAAKSEGEERLARGREGEARTTAEAAKAKAEKAEAETLEAFRASSNEAIEKLIGSKPSLGPQEKAYLTNTLERWKTFAARAGDDERSRAIRAEGHMWIAQLWQRLGQPDEAAAKFVVARDLYRDLADQFPARPLYRQNLAGSHLNLGVLFGDRSKPNESQAEYQQAIDLLSQLTAQFPDVPNYRVTLAATHSNMATLLDGRGKRDEARAELEKSREMRQRLADEFPSVASYQRELASVHTNIGLRLRQLQKRDDARKELDLALAIRRKLATQSPDIIQYQQDLARAHNNLAVVLKELGKRDEARAEFKSALDLKLKVANAFPAITAYQVDLAGGYHNFAAQLQVDGKPTESLEWFDKSIKLLTLLHHNDPQEAYIKGGLQDSHWGRAISLGMLKKHADALRDWDAAIELGSGPLLRAFRASSRVQAGLVAQAVDDVAELSKSESWSPGQWYDFACVYAVASSKAPIKKQEYADRAMELLHKAVKAGFKDAAHMAKDPDLASLRERKDFKTLLASLPTPKRPK